MKINVKERTAAIRRFAAYGPTPLEEGILQLIEDLSGAHEEEPTVEESEDTEEESSSEEEPSKS